MSASLRDQLVSATSMDFVRVHPEPNEGPFPARVTESMGFRLGQDGGLTIRSTINSGHGKYKLADDGKSIEFGGCAWTERGLARVSGDDEQGTLKRRMNEAEDFLQAKLSTAAGPYDVVSFKDNELVLKNRKDNTELFFRVTP